MSKKKQKKQAGAGSGYYMYGTHAVFAAAKNPKRKIKAIYCLERQAGAAKNQLKNFDIEIVNNDFITKKIGPGQAHQGIIALVDTIYKSNIEELNFNNDKDKVAILDQVTDPQNIGAIIRSAAAFGINKIIMPSDNAPSESAAIAKAACGCLELVEIAQVTNIKSTIDKLKKMGFWIAGLSGTGNNQMSEIKGIEKICVIVGSEGKGLRSLTEKSCDFLVNIPISESVESLNASVAASIVFYEIS